VTGIRTPRTVDESTARAGLAELAHLRARVRLLALDLDGTLLGPRGRLAPRVRSAVAAARSAGLDVVVCTGRRYRTTRPHLEALELEGAAVVQNGVLVKLGGTGETLRARYLERGQLVSALAAMQHAGPPFLFVDSTPSSPDYFVDRLDALHPFQLQYLFDTAHTAHFVPSLAHVETEALVMLAVMADAERLAEARVRITNELGERVKTNFLVNRNYPGHILEVVSAGSSKWRALRELAAERGIAPDQIAALGDDENDAEMLGACGLGLAMANATESAQRAARAVVPSCADDGAAMAIEWLLER
jgi:Cof subfamily protein (haloacid dehalogenase superfamily)